MMVVIAGEFAYVWSHRPGRSGRLPFRRALKYVEIKADDGHVYGGVETPSFSFPFHLVSSGAS